jgi:hypothetical protein
MYRLSLPPSPKCRQRGGRNATHTHSIRKKYKKHTCANQRDWEIQGIEKIGWKVVGKRKPSTLYRFAKRTVYKRKPTTYSSDPF